MFENPSVSLDVVLELEKIIHYNFSIEIKEIISVKALTNKNEVIKIGK